jgi:hypothetical protein
MAELLNFQCFMLIYLINNIRTALKNILKYDNLVPNHGSLEAVIGLTKMSCKSETRDG